MRARTVMLMFACLGLATPVAAGTTWVGAQLHFPVPARDLGDTQLGVDTGVTLTHMVNSYLGVGGDLIYHYWPASDGFEAAFDRYLRSNYLEALDGSTWAFEAFQVTGHLKLVYPTPGLGAPWVQIGGGLYRMNRNLDEQRPEGTYAWVGGTGLGDISTVYGGYGGIGFDLHLSSRCVVGLDGTYHYLLSRDEGWTGRNDLPDFSAFTAGMHVMFGR
jgi:hypothetical protein